MIFHEYSKPLKSEKYKKHNSS